MKATPINNAEAPVKVLRAEHVSDMTGLSRRAVVEKHVTTSKVHDESFPKPLRLTPRGSLGWLEAEVFRWIQTRPRVSVAGEVA